MTQDLAHMKIVYKDKRKCNLANIERSKLGGGRPSRGGKQVLNATAPVVVKSPRASEFREQYHNYVTLLSKK